ncbi:unnamed protein product [Mycena citricolor]|uniref:Uncharacterized protein n=1 Tax=Mycena citricolor TaxID=2018698 RepID=A0AAD2GZG2_9AGAR|nr:unnamed protein product [Mycena citricolor]
MFFSVITHAPQSKVAQAILIELQKAYEQLDPGAKIYPSSRARKCLPIIQRLVERALHLFEESRNGVVAMLHLETFPGREGRAVNPSAGIRIL